MSDKKGAPEITGYSGRSMKLRLWNNTMVSCLPVKSGSGLAGLPMGGPDCLAFRSFPGYAATLVGKGTGVDAGALQ